MRIVTIRIYRIFMLFRNGNLGLNVDDFIGQLHGSDDIQHVGRFADLLSIQKLEMVQASATHQYPEVLLLVVFKN